MYKPGVGGILVECRNLDGDMMDGVRGVRVVGYVDKDGKLELKIKKKLNHYLYLLRICCDENREQGFFNRRRVKIK